MTSILINDPIHGVIVLPKKIIHGLIDHPYFQRLRHIKQLGMVDLIFPTAVHTRFSHSIGTAYVAYKMANHLNLSSDHANYALVSALLHDIGHGPFSHAFEALLEKNIESDSRGTKILHERWTLHFLKGYETSLSEQGLDYKIVNQLIQGSYFSSAESKTSANKNTVADIISSQLDADRLDYLLRDSHFCGVSYGKADIEWIITHLSATTHPNYSSRLAVKETAWRAVEHFLLCRRMMLQNIYTHPKKNVLEKLLVEFLKVIARFLQTHSGEMIQNYDLRQFLTHVGAYRICPVGQKTSDECVSDFIEANFDYYKNLTDYDIWMLIRDFATPCKLPAASYNAIEIQTAQQIAQRIYARKAHQLFHFDAAYIHEVNAVVNQLIQENQLETWQLFMSENQVKSYEAQEDPILVLDEKSKKYLEIQAYSDLLRHMADKPEKESYLAIDHAIGDDKNRLVRDKFKKYIDFN